MSISNQQILDALFCLAPQFITTDPDTLACYNSIIALVRCQVSENVLKCCGLLVYVYLLAHMLTLRSNPTTGVISSMSEGELSISFAVSPDSDFLLSTSYGKAYSDLIRRTVFGGFNTGSSSIGLGHGSCGCG